VEFEGGEFDIDLPEDVTKLRQTEEE